MSQYYTADNMVVSVAGNFDKKETLNWIEDAFKDVPQKSKVDRMKRMVPHYHQAFFEKKKDIEQLHLNLGFVAPAFTDDKRHTAAILNCILGGDVNSRLFQGIREKYGLTYSVYSYGSSFSDTGLLHIYAAMNPQQKDKVYSLISETIEDLRKNGIKKEELENAKKQTIVEMTLSQDSTSSLMSGNAKLAMYDMPFIPFKERAKRLEKVTKSQVNDLIMECLDLETVSMGIIGPR